MGTAVAAPAQWIGFTFAPCGPEKQQHEHDPHPSHEVSFHGMYGRKLALKAEREQAAWCSIKAKASRRVEPIGCTTREGSSIRESWPARLIRTTRRVASVSTKVLTACWHRKEGKRRGAGGSVGGRDRGLGRDGYCHGPSAPWPTFARRERKRKSAITVGMTDKTGRVAWDAGQKWQQIHLT